MNKKKIITIICLLLVAILLVSCTYGSYVTKRAYKQFSSQRMYMRYESFSGHLSRKVRIPAGEMFVITITTQTNSGSLTVQVLDENDAVLVSQDTKTTDKAAYDIPARQDKAVYKIKVEGKHGGSFDIIWATEKMQQ